MRKTVFVSILALLFTTNSVNATLGPVHCLPNQSLWKQMAGHARANTFNGLNIIFRINVDIQVHDWIKVWFPDSEDVKGIENKDFSKLFCDGFPAINGSKESPRFIPNDLYFRKYPNSQETTYGKLYRFTDEKKGIVFEKCPDVSKLPDWADACESKDGRPRLIKDPSGLGCWMMGTVMPAMPYDPVERNRRIHEFMGSTHYYYESLTEEQGYPIIVNTCFERSWQINALNHVPVDRTRWNPVSICTTPRTGILSPATPGRYKVFVATQQEPELVESETFVLPCSSVSDVRIETTNLSDPDSFLSVKFKTGEGGALDRYGSKVMLKISKNVKLSKSIPIKSIKMNGQFAEWFAPSKINVESFDDNFNIISIYSYTDIGNNSICSIDFTGSSQLQLPKDDKSVIVEISSSSEPNFVTSEPTVCHLHDRSAVDSGEEFDNAGIKFNIPIQGETLKGTTEVNITFPEGFVLPKIVPAESIVVNNEINHMQSQSSGQTLKIRLSRSAINLLSIWVTTDCGITNPKIGSHEVSVDVQGKTFDFTINTIESTAKLYPRSSNPAYGGIAKISIEFKPSSLNPMSTGDCLTISGDGQFQEGEVDPGKITLGKDKALEASVESGKLKIQIPETIDVKSYCKIRINIDYVHPKSRYDHFRIETSRGDFVESKAYELAR